MRRPAAIGSSLALALVLAMAAALLLPAPARPAPAAGDATARDRLAVAGVPVMPVSDVRPGMVGRGLTVVQGSRIESFGVRVLGVQRDGIAPGIDLILVKLSGDLIERTGGVVAGMSGSPVYVGGRLVGAVAYGFFGGDFTVAGLTPAGPMLEILRYPNTIPSRVAWPPEVALAPELRRVAAAAAAGDGEMRQLAIPLVVSGLNERALDLLREGVREAGLPFVVTAGGRAAAPSRRPARTDPLHPGSVYSAVVSYGDLTVAGIGTTTARVGRRSVAFGHPFFFSGPTRLGLNGGSVLGVVKSIFFPFKLANVGLPHGTLTQDRLAGVAGVAGRFPDLTPVSVSLRNLDIRRMRAGATRIVREFEFLDDLAFFALLAEFDRAFDRIGSGSARLAWTIAGIRSGGQTFRFHRENMFDAEFDLAIEALIEPAFANLSAIARNPFEQVSITRVRLEGDLTQRHRALQIAQVAVSSTSRPEPVVGGPVQARPGDTLTVVVTLRPRRGAQVTKTLRLQVPGFASGSLQLVVRGGRGSGSFDAIFFEEPEPEPGAGSLDDLLQQLEDAERNNDLIAELQEAFFGEPVPEGEPAVEGSGPGALVQVRRSLSSIVRGEVVLEVIVGGSSGSSPPGA